MALIPLAENRRLIGRPFPPGVSGNPGGRPKGLAHLIREATAQGQELVDFMLAVFRGRPIGTGTRRFVPTLAERLTTTTWLADRGFGRSIQGIVGAVATEPPAPDYWKLTDEELQEVIRLAAKVAPPLPAAPDAL